MVDDEIVKSSSFVVVRSSKSRSFRGVKHASDRALDIIPSMSFMRTPSGTNFLASPQYKPDKTHGEYEEESRHHEFLLHAPSSFSMLIK